MLGNGTAGNDGSIASASIVLAPQGGGTAALEYNIFGSETYSGVISGSGTLIKAGPGTIELASSNTYSGPTNVSGGTLQVDTTGALPLNSALNVSAGAKVVAKDLGGGVNAQVLVLSATPTLSGSLNLTTNDLLVHGSTLTAINTYVKQGFNNGAWNGTSGITSSSAAGSRLYALGVIQDSVDGTTSGSTLYSSFDNQPASSGDVLVKYTYYGDATLDGEVNGSDYSRIDYAYLNNQNASNTQLTGWFNGDFNYDGVINGSDYTLIDNAFNTQGALIAAEVARPTAEIAGGAGTSAVPEPASLGLLGIGVACLLGRRRRR
jgi:autotransporter-associated beta strand protein